MFTIVVVVLLVSVAAIAAARYVPQLRGFAIVGGSMLLAVVAFFVWWMLLLLQIVPVDSLMRAVGAHTLDPPWSTLLILGPPLLVAALFAAVQWRRSSRGGAAR